MNEEHQGEVSSLFADPVTARPESENHQSDKDAKRDQEEMQGTRYLNIEEETLEEPEEEGSEGRQRAHWSAQCCPAFL